MAFKKVTGGAVTYIKPSELEEGFQLIGTYLATRDSKNFEGAVTHYFKTEDGEVGLNGAGQLNYLIDQISKGDLVRITYLGMEPYKGKSVHTFSLEVDDAAVESKEDKIKKAKGVA